MSQFYPGPGPIPPTQPHYSHLMSLSYNTYHHLEQSQPVSVSHTPQYSTNCPSTQFINLGIIQTYPNIHQAYPNIHQAYLTQNYFKPHVTLHNTVRAHSNTHIASLTAL